MKSADAELAKQKQDMEKGIKNLEETLKKMSPDQQKSMQDLVKQMKDQMASLDIYRAGKPAVDAARTFAQDWLKELKVTP